MSASAPRAEVQRVKLKWPGGEGGHLPVALMAPRAPGGRTRASDTSVLRRLARTVPAAVGVRRLGARRGPSL